MAIEKKYLKSKPMCKVTFTLPQQEGLEIKKAAIVGDFNRWNPTENEMRKSKTGEFVGSVTLPKDSSYQFRYYVNNETWITEQNADGFMPTNVSYDSNAVIEL